MTRLDMDALMTGQPCDGFTVLAGVAQVSGHTFMRIDEGGTWTSGAPLMKRTVLVRYGDKFFTVTSHRFSGDPEVDYSYEEVELQHMDVWCPKPRSRP